MNLEQNRSQIESALRTLDTAGFETKELWRVLAQRTSEYERGTPDDDDLRYEVPDKPPQTSEHFQDGQPQELSANVMWVGFSYTLTPGQRAWLRENCGLTPTRTVTIRWLELWPQSRNPRAVKLESDVHVNPKNRRHILTAVVLRNVGKFLREAEEITAREESKRQLAQLVPGALTLGRQISLESVDRWAIEDITGVRVDSKIEIVGLTEERFDVLCLKSGRTARVPRLAFFETVEEYSRLYRERPRRNAAQAQSVPDALDELVKSLSL